jgi:hypothetical protein
VIIVSLPTYNEALLSFFAVLAVLRLARSSSVTLWTDRTRRFNIKNAHSIRKELSCDHSVVERVLKVDGPKLAPDWGMNANASVVY